jgi:hypothetical protein
MGVVKDSTGSFSLGLLTIATGTLVGGLVLLALGHDRRLEATVPHGSTHPSTSTGE